MSELFGWKYIKPVEQPGIVARLSSQRGAALPADLASFLEERNGGRPVQAEFDTDRSQGRLFKCLCNYNEGALENIRDALKNMPREKNLYPIGFDCGGNTVCYDFVSNNYVLVDHETGTTERIIAESNPGLFFRPSQP